jgi:DNA-binding response OmpR family regulator
MSADKRILLVAARDEFSDEFARRLEREGAHVRLTDSSEEALATVREGFDLIVLDLELAAGDALSLLRELRSDGAAQTPVYLLKGEGEPAHVVQRGLDFGASGYVIKHRLPGESTSARILDELVKKNGRRDACPFSASGEFGPCTVFLPINVHMVEDGGEAHVTCSHLRIGASSSWRLYPRCAIGDRAARDRYQEERTPV